ncbi:MAG TPA: HAD family hydrolase [Holophaga sp.]|nr:HAD family hydrolase [Holophaga sp.]
MIRAAVFDLWGTLVHSPGGDPYLALRDSLTEAQREYFAALKQDAQSRVHPDAATFLAGWAAPLGLDPARLDEFAGIFRAAEAEAACFPEALEALARARQVARLGLLSNTQSFGMGFLDRLGLVPLIPNRFLSAHTGFRKPQPEAFEAVQKKLGLFPGELIMIGDSWQDDVQGALQAGWTAVWLNRAGRPRPEHDPEAELVEVSSLAQVPEVIENLQAGARCSTCLG